MFSIEEDKMQSVTFSFQSVCKAYWSCVGVSGGGDTWVLSTAHPQGLIMGLEAKALARSLTYCLQESPK